MSLDEASKLLDFSQLSLVATIAVVFGYCLIPTFIILCIVNVIRKHKLNKNIHKQIEKNTVNKKSKKQIKIDKEFESTSILSEKLGDIKEPTDKSKFESLDLTFDINGKALRRNGGKA